MRLHLLRVGTVRALNGPIPAYVIRLDDGTNILVDTGAALEPAPDLPPGAGLDVDASQHIVAQLAGLGLTPPDINLVICTHLHPDHAGNNDAFPDADFVVQRAEHEAALAGAHPTFAWARQQWDAPGLTYKPVDGDTVIAPGVELIDSRGHSPGHQSVLVRLPNTGPVLIAGDALPFASTINADTRGIGPFDFDPPAVRSSTRRLADLAATERVAFIVFSHDAAQWSALRTGADYYD
jgi:N-acyl homoserine lactone hydrolase